ncbi:MAG: bifunctional phosphopantothenoylcysteine decarboxylase/phosphopantothenate--cysteine ligase CoaBC, partial [Ignavibacteriales bacterium]|nr:bifunctional phosphopantothenoylcysteine decarboxylase/phosphopantothenate--cysteine ligase CoaBC [Ignavibacteriales bacterium]
MIPEDPIRGAKIVVGVTGGIAAYKACLLVRELKRRGAETRVVMTPAAAEFVSPLTFAALSESKTIVEMFPDRGDVEPGVWHVETALWADVTVVAPATVNTVAKAAAGIADNALTTLLLATRTPVLYCPSADLDMYERPATRENLDALRRRGAYVLEADRGYLASGLEGRGRLPNERKIVDAAEFVLSGGTRDLEGKRVLVTAGPTLEDIDPVRFIGNRSSGKMGFRIAEVAALRGADTTLVTGPVALETYQEIERIDVRSAEAMKREVDLRVANSDILVMAAAAADFRPATRAENKLKKDAGVEAIALEKTDDILANVPKEGRVVVGFALETENELENARAKLERKNLDMIVLNSLRD